MANATRDRVLRDSEDITSSDPKGTTVEDVRYVVRRCWHSPDASYSVPIRGGFRSKENARAWADEYSAERDNVPTIIITKVTSVHEVV